MSQIKYLYISDTADTEPPLENGEGVMVIDAEGAYYISALISNELYNSDIYAPEINWYLKYTQADKDEKKEIFKILYEIRYIRHLHTVSKKDSLDVGRNIAIIGDGETALAFVKYAKRFFEVEHIFPSKLVSVEGKLGNFKVNFEAFNEEAEKNEQKETLFAQIIFCEEEPHLTKYMGVESLKGSDEETLVKRFRNRIGWYEYDESITFNPSICLYEHKEEPTCRNCIDICPTFGLTHDEDKKELHFSHLDCIDCGACVSVCPNGAIDFTHFTQEAFLQVAKLCRERKVLLIAEKYLKEIEDVAIPEGFLPLVVETDRFLTQFHLESLVQEGGTAVLLYAPQISPVSAKAVEFFNETPEDTKKFFVAQSKKELQESLKLMEIKG